MQSELHTCIQTLYTTSHNVSSWRGGGKTTTYMTHHRDSIWLQQRVIQPVLGVDTLSCRLGWWLNNGSNVLCQTNRQASHYIQAQTHNILCQTNRQASRYMQAQTHNVLCQTNRQDSHDVLCQTNRQALRYMQAQTHNVLCQTNRQDSHYIQAQTLTCRLVFMYFVEHACRLACMYAFFFFFFFFFLRLGTSADCFMLDPEQERTFELDLSVILGNRISM